MSKFLSPRHDVRTDGWGGSLENRVRSAGMERALEEGAAMWQHVDQ